MVPFYKMNLRFQALNAVTVPRFAAATWRGAFGFALKQTVCVMRLRPCEGCQFEYTCAYPFVFETRPKQGSGVMTRYDRAPHPFVLDPPQDGIRADPGDLVDLGVTVIGSAITTLPYLLHAFERAGQRGIGRSRHGQLGLVEVTDREKRTIWRPGEQLQMPEVMRPRQLPDDTQRVKLTFETPLRLTREGVPVDAKSVTGGAIAMAAVRRVGLLNTFFGDTNVEVNFRGLKEESKAVEICDQDLVWGDKTRFSSRQKRLIKLGGLLGTVVLDVGRANSVIPFLSSCADIHLGKGATLGYGRMNLELAMAP